LQICELSNLSEVTSTSRSHPRGTLTLPQKEEVSTPPLNFLPWDVTSRMHQGEKGDAVTDSQNARFVFMFQMLALFVCFVKLILKKIVQFPMAPATQQNTMF
jgi:hypothetical protein